MQTNIYKGQTTGWYEFDKIIYGNTTNLDPKDEVMLGRYVLLCYCETAFSEEQKKLIENGDGTNLSEQEANYWKNYSVDKISKDRMIYKKVYKDEKIQYIEIGRINEIKEGNLNFSGEKTPEGGEIFNDYENNQARTPMSSARGEGTVAGGRGFEIIGFVEELINYFEPYLGSKTEDGYGWKFDVVLPPGTYTITEYTGGTAYSGSIINKATGNKLYSWNFGFIEEKGTYGTIVTAGNNPFELTTETTISVDYFNPDTDTCCRCFNNDKRVKGYKLKDSTDNIVEGDTYSVRIGNNYDNQGIIESVDKDNNTVTVTNSTKGTTTTLTNAYLWLPVMPEDWSTYDDPETKKSLKATRKINAGTTYMDAAQYAEGSETYAIKYAAHAEGNRSVAAGRWSHAEGNGTYAVYGAHSEGLQTKALGQGSHSEGNKTVSQGYYSHSEGCITNALGGSSHSEGFETTAQGEFSHAEGLNSVSIGEGSHAEGYNCKATGDNSHAEGNQTESSGKHSHAEGLKTKAIGDYSHSMGIDTTAEKSGAFAGGTGSHALGNNSFAFGSGAYALGDGAIAMGYGAQAQTFMNVAMGKNAIASGGRSISLGEYVTTSSNNQFAVGIYNRPEAAAGHKLPVFMVGYGTSESDRKNVFEVDRNGVATVGADPIDNMDVATKQYVDNSISSLNPTVDLSGYMPLTGGTMQFTDESSIVPSTITFNKNGIDCFDGIVNRTKILNGEIELDGPYAEDNFIINYNGVSGSETAKNSWLNWLNLTPSLYLTTNGGIIGDIDRSYTDLGSGYIAIKRTNLGQPGSATLQIYTSPYAQYASGALSLKGGEGTTITHEFFIDAFGVEGNDTSKASWRQWLGITTEDGSIDLSALENKITQLENRINELENASPVLKE